MELRAIPVTMPGRAIGKITNSEMTSRPKNRYRATASDARVPRTSAISVATSATVSDVRKACCSPVFLIASPNQCRVNPTGGQDGVVPALKA